MGFVKDDERIPSAEDCLVLGHAAASPCCADSKSLSSLWEKKKKKKGKGKEKGKELSDSAFSSIASLYAHGWILPFPQRFPPAVFSRSYVAVDDSVSFILLSFSFFSFPSRDL